MAPYIHGKATATVVLIKVKDLFSMNNHYFIKWMTNIKRAVLTGYY